MGGGEFLGGGRGEGVGEGREGVRGVMGGFEGVYLLFFGVLGWGYWVVSWE